MRLLLDECVDQQLRHHFQGHDCQTVRYAGLAGLENGGSATGCGGSEIRRPFDRGSRLPIPTELGESQDCGHHFRWEIRSSGRPYSVNTDLH